MKHLAFYPIIILVFYLCVPVCSGYTTFTIVSGEGTESVNGYYFNMGTHPTDSDGVDYYQKGDLYLYRVEFDEVKAWMIGDILGNTHMDYWYYSVISSNNTPIGLTMTYNTSKGELPFPTIRRYGSAVSIINLLLD